MRISLKWSTPKIKNPWARSSVILNQNLHVQQVINELQAQNVSSNFEPWQQFCKGQAPWDIVLLSWMTWKKLQDIAQEVDLQHSRTVFVAVNKYLLLPESDPSCSDDYDIAIRQRFSKLLTNYQVCEYRYHSHERGDVGNFVVPDNRFLCKKI